MTYTQLPLLLGLGLGLMVPGLLLHARRFPTEPFSRRARVGVFIALLAAAWLIGISLYAQHLVDESVTTGRSDDLPASMLGPSGWWMLGGGALVLLIGAGYSVFQLVLLLRQQRH